MSIGKIALAGNPNVGKSTVFNALTGMKQHTGNWSGKTVGLAEGVLKRKGEKIELVDLPGTYSMITDSAEEEITRNYLCFGDFDAAVVVCDACCLERNLILALQVAQLVPKVLICVNMLDDARKKGITISFSELSKVTGLPSVGISAATGEGLFELEKAMEDLLLGKLSTEFVPVRYPKEIEAAAKRLLPLFKEKYGFFGIYPVLRALENEHGFIAELERRYGKMDEELKTALEREKSGLNAVDIPGKTALCTALRAEEICLSAVSAERGKADGRDEKIDSVLTGRWIGIPVMLFLFGFIFWLTVSGANLPSEWLFRVFFEVGLGVEKVLNLCEIDGRICSFVVDGVLKITGWVVAVMLPPMAIFFPLFTILEDMGYLPRVAFNLDRGFKSSGACGKQALTMWSVFRKRRI